MTEQEFFADDHIHTTLEGRHFRHGDGVEVDGEGNPLTAPMVFGLEVPQGTRIVPLYCIRAAYILTPEGDLYYRGPEGKVLDWNDDWAVVRGEPDERNVPRK